LGKRKASQKSDLFDGTESIGKKQRNQVTLAEIMYSPCTTSMKPVESMVNREYILDLKPVEPFEGTPESPPTGPRALSSPPTPDDDGVLEISVLSDDESCPKSTVASIDDISLLAL
jgi:hypothetical protein